MGKPDKKQRERARRQRKAERRAALADQPRRDVEVTLIGRGTGAGLNDDIPF